MVRSSFSFRPLLLVMSTVLLASCTAARSTSGGNSGWGTPALRTELYFGRSRPAEADVSDREWGAFLDSAITPRFPEGLTVLDADGQYRSTSGVIVRERSKLLILIHDGSASRLEAIEMIERLYKGAFRQESVLRVTSSVDVRF